MVNSGDFGEKRGNFWLIVMILKSERGYLWLVVMILNMKEVIYG